MKIPGNIDLTKFGIEVDKENERLIIPKQALAEIEKYFFDKVQQTGMGKKNIYKSAYITAKWQLVYNTLKLFDGEEDCESGASEALAQHTV